MWVLPKIGILHWFPPLSCVCVYIYIDTYIYICACIYIYIFTHTHTHTHPKYSKPVIPAFKKGNLHIALKPGAQVGLIGRGISLAIPHRSKYPNIGAAGPRYNSDYDL